MMDNANEVPRHSSGLIAIISRRASNAANAIRGVDGALDIEFGGNGGHHHLSQSNQRRRGEREAGGWLNGNNSRDGHGPASAIAAAAASPVLSTSGTISNMLRRRRSADMGTNGVPGSSGPIASALAANRRSVMGQPGAAASNTAASPISSGPSMKIRLVPHLENTRSLRFEPIARELRAGDPPLRIGRFTDRHNATANANRLAFKSKVVSRGHAEVWLESGKFYIRDTKSSSGTFLNHQRLAPPSQESKPYALKDGDILQLGVDFQGGHEDIYKCVKIRVEIGREWQKGSNAFNSQAMNTLRALSGTNNDPNNKPTKKVKNSGDCCICLFGLQICQAIFIAPCSHSFHYKCIRPLLEAHHPGFTCPLCRTFADLTEDVEVEDEGEDIPEEIKAAEEPTPFIPGGTLAGATLNGREGGLGPFATMNGASNTNALGLITNGPSIPASPGATTPVTASNTVITSLRYNPNRNSTGSAMQIAEESDAEMYDREESVDRRVGGVTDAEFSMPPATTGRRRETGLTAFEEEPRGFEEGHFEDHENSGVAMDVEQEAEEQALRDGGRDMEEVQEATGTSSSNRNSEEIVANVIGGSQTQLADESHWDRTYVPDDSAMVAVEESPRSSHDGSSRNAVSVGPAMISNNSGNTLSPRGNTARITTIETSASASQSQPNLATQSPQSPSIRGRLIRVPSLTSPYLSNSNRQKRRSISRFGGALSENEGNTVLGSGFLGTLLGRKRGASISVNPGSPITPQGDGAEDGVGSTGGSAEGHNAGTSVGEKRKR